MYAGLHPRQPRGPRPLRRAGSPPEAARPGRGGPRLRLPSWPAVFFPWARMLAAVESGERRGRAPRVPPPGLPPARRRRGGCGGIAPPYDHPDAGRIPTGPGGPGPVGTLRAERVRTCALVLPGERASAICRVRLGWRAVRPGSGRPAQVALRPSLRSCSGNEDCVPAKATRIALLLRQRQCRGGSDGGGGGGGGRRRGIYFRRGGWTSRPRVQDSFTSCPPTHLRT
jgi:hypothetical protein